MLLLSGFTIPNTFADETDDIIISNERPEDGAKNVSILLSELMFDLNESQGNPMEYRYGTDPDIGSSGSFVYITFGNATNCSVPVSGLDWNTVYTWWVNATIARGDYKNETFYFTTEKANQAPVANFSYLAEGLKVTFDGSMSNDSDGTIANYTWDFGDGSNLTYNVTNPVHIFADNGSYDVNLTIKDDDGATDSMIKTIEVANARPKVGFKYEPDGKTVTFTSTSYDIDGTIANYTWNFGDGSNLTYNVTNPVHTYELENAEYDVTLTVTDNLDLSNSTTQTIKTGDNTLPTVKIVKPMPKGIYLFNDFKLSRFLLPTLIIGSITIEVNATDEGGIERVDFYIDPLRSFGKPVGNDTEPDETTGFYTYDWTRNRPRILFRYHKIRVEAFDYAGNSATAEILVKRIL